MSFVVDAAVAGSVAVSLLAVPRLRPQAVPEAEAAEPRAAWWARPLPVLAVVVALVYVNQVLFTIHVLRVHAGDPSFVARYLPQGWFALADGPAMRAAARHFPAPEVLAPSVLRVQAFLELPLVLLAYAAVLRGLDRGLYRRVAGSALVWAASASYTLVFCVVEWSLRSPYTVDDIVIRVCAAVATPLWIRWAARREDDGPGPGLLAFAASTWALGHLVLTVYDTALLYNLGHLEGRLPSAVLALAVLLGARHIPSPAPGPAGRMLAVGLGWALALFFVPALAVRYGVTFGTPLLAAAAGLLVCLVAVTCALREGLADMGPAQIRVWTLQMAGAAVAGSLLAYAALRAVNDTYYEAGLLRAVAVLFVTVVVACAFADRRALAGTDVRRDQAGTSTGRSSSA